MAANYMRTKGIPAQQGLTIIEIMVALLLSSLLTLGLVQIFTSNSQTFRLNEANSRVQESGRIALEILSRAVRNAGYYGCQPPNGFTNNLDTSHADFDESQHGFNQDRAIFSGASGRPGDALNDTDYIRITGLAGDDLDLRAEDNINSANLKLTDTGNLENGDIIFITDCMAGDILQVGNVNANSGTVGTPTGNNFAPSNDFSNNDPDGCSSNVNCLSAVYDAGTRIMKASIANYYLADQDNHDEPALVRETPLRRDALVSGLIGMRIQYGTGSNGTVTQWQEVGDMDDADWPRVLAARISVLVRSATDNVVDEPQTICFPGPTWDGQDCDDASNLETMPDRRLYRVYTTTAAVRNRA